MPNVSEACGPCPRIPKQRSIGLAAEVRRQENETFDMQTLEVVHSETFDMRLDETFDMQGETFDMRRFRGTHVKRLKNAVRHALDCG